MAQAETAASPAIALTTEQFQQLLASVRPDAEAQANLIKLQAEANAKAHQQLTRPENPTLPPDPRPHFVAEKVTWAGTRVDREVCTTNEIEALNALTPGTYHCSKADGTKFPVTVALTKNAATGKVETLAVDFVTKGDAKNGLMPLVAMCREIAAQAKVPVKVA